MKVAALPVAVTLAVIMPLADTQSECPVDVSGRLGLTDGFNLCVEMRKKTYGTYWKKEIIKEPFASCEEAVAWLKKKTWAYATSVWDWKILEKKRTDKFGNLIYTLLWTVEPHTTKSLIQLKEIEWPGMSDQKKEAAKAIHGKEVIEHEKCHMHLVGSFAEAYLEEHRKEHTVKVAVRGKSRRAWKPASTKWLRKLKNKKIIKHIFENERKLGRWGRNKLPKLAQRYLEKFNKTAYYLSNNIYDEEYTSHGFTQERLGGSNIPDVVRLLNEAKTCWNSHCCSGCEKPWCGIEPCPPDLCICCHEDLCGWQKTYPKLGICKYDVFCDACDAYDAIASSYSEYTVKPMYKYNDN